jgi:predicted AAA+ superfamily ATPase
MRYVHRAIAPELTRALRQFPAVVLTGPRRAGKTFLLRHLLPKASYHLLEDPAVIARLREDPTAFLDGIRLPAILDEIQNVPEIFAHVRARIDASPRRVGRWILTGSQESTLMRGITESMAGRAAILRLWPLSVRESAKVTLLRGGFPEVIARPRAARLWFDSYMQTYLERDVRAVTNVHDLATFRRFVGLVAARHGQVSNKADLAAPLGMSIPGVGKWLDILEATQQILVVPPYFENVGKRLVKSPKIYLADSGLACHLLGIDDEAALNRSPFAGALFEGFLASEIVKAQSNAGRRRELYWFRDARGLEVDFVVPGAGGAVTLVEAKSTATPTPSMADPLLALAAAFRAKHRGDVACLLVHRSSKNGPATHALKPGVRAITDRDFIDVLKRGI